MSIEVSVERIPAGTPYQQVHQRQLELRQAIIDANAPQTILLVQHQPVITLGRGANPEHIKQTLLASSPLAPEVIAIERGGEVTYHSPAQAVMYPILDLKLFKRDISWYMRLLEQSVLNLLQHSYAITAQRSPGEAGVWLLPTTTTARRKKIASVGVHLAKWVSVHGVALNVNADDGGFGLINPCGFTNIEITSIEQETGRSHEVSAVATALAKEFASLLGVTAVFT